MKDVIFELSARARLVLMLPATFQLTLRIPFATTLQAHEHRETRTPCWWVRRAHTTPIRAIRPIGFSRCGSSRTAIPVTPRRRIHRAV